MPDSLGDRMKRYETVSSGALTTRMPVIVRIDGRAFHTYTRGFRPFDHVLQKTMVQAAQKVAEEMQGFEVAYHQSDEVSFLLTDYAELNTSAWFDYVTQKVCTISASVMTAWFNKLMLDNLHNPWRFDPNYNPTQVRYVDREFTNYEELISSVKAGKKIAYFDARAFNVPKEDVTNYYLWRAKDWERNSISMYCRQFFSAKQLHGQGRSDQHEMLHGIGKNWATDVMPEFRNGSFILPDKIETSVRADYKEISALIDPLVYKDKYEKIELLGRSEVRSEGGDSLSAVRTDTDTIDHSSNQKL